MALTLGRFIRLRREALGLTQTELAVAVQRDQTYISQLERDRLQHLPGPAFVRRLTEALETTPVALFRAMGYLAPEDLLTGFGNEDLLARMLEFVEELDLPEHLLQLLRLDLTYLYQRARLIDEDEDGFIEYDD